MDRNHRPEHYSTKRRFSQVFQVFGEDIAGHQVRDQQKIYLSPRPDFEYL